MNANEIWSGNDYAHTDYISRGVNFYENAHRVKAMRVYKEMPRYSSERATTMVEVMMLDVETGEPRTGSNGEPYMRNVRARDIFMRWDEYAREKKNRIEKAEQRAREARELKEAEEARKEALLVAFETKLGMRGFNRLMVRSINDYAITLDRSMVEEWLLSQPVSK